MNSFGAEEKRNIPLTLVDRKRGIKKSFVTKYSLEIDMEYGIYVKTSNKSYSDIYENTEYQLVNDYEYTNADFISEILSFLEENCDLIKEHIEYFRGGENNGS